MTSRRKQKSLRPAKRPQSSQPAPRTGTTSVVRRRRDLLLDVGRALATVESLEGALARVARICVPEVAEMCVADVLSEDGRVRRVEAVHVDPSTFEAMKDVKRAFAPRPEHPVLQVFAKGRPLLDAEVGDDELARIARDPAHLVILRRFGPKSSMRVPVVVDGLTRGVLSFLITDSPRRFAASDLDFAEQIVDRIVTALERPAGQ